VFAVRMSERVGSNACGTGTPFPVSLPAGAPGTGLAAATALAGPKASPWPEVLVRPPGALVGEPALEHAARRTTAGRSHRSRFITYLPSPGIPGCSGRRA